MFKYLIRTSMYSSLVTIKNAHVNQLQGGGGGRLSKWIWICKWSQLKKKTRHTLRKGINTEGLSVSLLTSLWVKCRESQRDVVCLGWLIAPSYISSKCGGGGELRDLSQWVQLYLGGRSPNKLWRSNSIFSLWLNVLTCRRGLAHPLPGAAAWGQTRHISTRQAFKSAGFQNSYFLIIKI